MLLSGSWDKTIRIWDIETGQTLQTLTGHSDFVKSLVVLNSNSLLTASSDKTIRKFDLKTGKTLAILKGHTRGVESLVLDFDKKYLYSGSSDTTIKKCICFFKLFIYLLKFIS